jgi:transposase
VVEHIDAEIKECPSCGCEVKGAFPSGVSGPLQYGDGLKAWLVTLVVVQMVALRRAADMVRALIGVTISEQTILTYILRLHAALEPWEREARTRLLEAKALHCDETSLRVAKRNHWIHVYSAGELTVKFLHEKRGREAADDIGVLPKYGGIAIHDCWASYFSYEGCSHGLCGSHLLRELVFIIESNGYAWAKNMKKLLQETCRKVAKRKRRTLSKREYANLQKRYRNILTRGAKELPHVPERIAGQRGRVAKSDAHNLHERLTMHEDAVLIFARNPHVSFTNNRAERDLRMSKVKQKVSGCFRSVELAQAYCRISSYLQTMANRGYNPLIAIQLALEGKAQLHSQLLTLH